MLSFLTTGIILGLAAGFAPGPLLALVISESLQHGSRSGIRVAFAPILTDIPIIGLALLFLNGISHLPTILGVISIMGSLFILYLGIENFRTQGVNLQTKPVTPKSLRKGVLVNVLSPHPYIFWFSVGGPLIFRAMDNTVAAALAFVGAFYVLLVGIKVMLAILAGRSRSFLLGNKYIYTMRLLGFLLLVLAGFLFRDGLQLLGIIG